MHHGASCYHAGMTHARPLVVAAMLALLAGCQTVRSGYYNAWEKLGYDKRQRLTDNVKAARAEQANAKQQFASALDEFKSVVRVEGGELQKGYDRLNAAYEKCSDQADAVNSKISSVKNVGTALFDEWRGEIGQIQDASLKSQSQTLYDKTKANYAGMIERMDAAAATMPPVVQAFKDRVLVLKGSLNAQAIASLRDTEIGLSGEIDKLIKEMEASIAEADAFIAQTSSAN